MPDISQLADMGVPDFTGAPTEAKRIAGGGRVGKDLPTGPPMVEAPLQSADPEK